MRNAFKRVLVVAAVVLSILILHKELSSSEANAQATCKRFDETGHTVCGRFLQYWNSNGGLSQQGYPISEPFSELSNSDGKIYTVQYFERAVFELHLENPAPNDILLSLLGSFRYREKYPTGAPQQIPNTLSSSQLFSQTGKRLGGVFLTYWQSHGGLAQQGYPISDEFLEISDSDGKLYKVQYFERGVFEEHPEKKPPFDVLLSQLGTYRLHDKYGNGSALPEVPAFASGGLGMTRAEWEQIHGSGIPDPSGESSAIVYENGKYSVVYADNGRAGVIFVSYNPQAALSRAQDEVAALLPYDAERVSHIQIPQAGVPEQLEDIEFSQTLGTLFPSTMPPMLEGGLGTRYGIWLGSPPGTFTVNYSVVVTGSDTTIEHVLIFLGSEKSQ